MPHPKNRLKLTGDTHLPDIGDLLERADADEPAVLEFDAEPRVYADGWAPSGAEALPAEEQALPEPVTQVERAVEKRMAATPWLAVGGALAFGFLVAKMLRR
ncbi:hypothetical protein GCM10028796_17800 [Ramlibacter monticola]|uniref:Uncharacterized protein n=1 Tax=Ramlibacter monticola TaxID=1926872 RepID=A0A936YXW5_9BURK|nr:hypothetical protein [Ramlibacter monticola]MBL0390606.1 hypothetical protein [Ramlibacter monticola]